MTTTQPSLFGLKNSNRDFAKADSWGKNVFNNTFPAALACYLKLTGKGVLDKTYLPYLATPQGVGLIFYVSARSSTQDLKDNLNANH